MHVNFACFLRSSWNRAWIVEPGLDLYVRRSLPNRETDFDLANLSAHEMGKGALTRFLDEQEPVFSFFVENVINLRLAAFLVRRGYEAMTPNNVSLGAFVPSDDLANPGDILSYRKVRRDDAGNPVFADPNRPAWRSLFLASELPQTISVRP